MFDYQAPEQLLKGKIILVTGAGDGIGKTIAKTYANHGATVVLLGRTLSKLEAVYDEIEQANGAQPALCPFNLLTAGPDDYQELFNTLKAEFGHLDGLVHNASILGKVTPIELYPVEEWLEVMQVNTNAPFILSQTLLPLLKASESSSIVFTSSGVGRVGRAYWGAYAVSKFATEGLMQVMADELENTTVRVNAINPGATRTAMRAKAYPAEDAKTLATAEEIMPVYLYLMGADSQSVNKQSLNAQ